MIFLIINAAFFLAELIASYRLTGASPATGITSQVLLLFGAKKLPELARSIGQAGKEVRKGFSDGAGDDSDTKKSSKKTKA